MKLNTVLCVVACLLSIAVQILETHEKGNDDDDYDNNIYENDSEIEEEYESSDYEYNSQASNKRNSENSDSSHDDYRESRTGSKNEEDEEYSERNQDDDEDTDEEKRTKRNSKHGTGHEHKYGSDTDKKLDLVNKTKHDKHSESKKGHGHTDFDNEDDDDRNDDDSDEKDVKYHDNGKHLEYNSNVHHHEHSEHDSNEDDFRFKYDFDFDLHKHLKPDLDLDDLHKHLKSDLDLDDLHKYLKQDSNNNHHYKHSKHDSNDDDYHHKHSKRDSDNDGDYDHHHKHSKHDSNDDDYHHKHSKHDSDDDHHKHSKHDSDEDDDDHDDKDDNNHKHPKHHGHKCRFNEEKTDCVQPKDCVTCRHKDPCPVFVCNPGCNCKKGYFRNKSGICIQEAFCHKHPDKKCPRNEEPGCEQPEGCLTYENRVYCHTYFCNHGCVCKPYHYRNKKGVCVPEEKCPKEKCDNNEEFRKCGPVCEGCEGARCLSTACIPKCYCKSGYFRNDDKKCVKKEDCPGHDDSHRCWTDEEYYRCKPTCRDTCENYDDELAACPKLCRPGCACRKGTVKNKYGACVQPYQCENAYPHKCKQGEAYYKCKPTCRHTCENYNDKHANCTEECRPGCACKKGLVKNKKGKCVEPDECEDDHHHECKKGEEYYKCKPTCRDTCENYDDKYAKCSKECRPGCACKKGLVKNKKGECVEPDECEDDHPHRCKKNEEYCKCKPTCRDTCENYDDKYAKCSKECRPGCACKKGLVKNKKGECVEPDECEDDHPHRCKKNEEYYKCKPTCRDTCENYDDKYAKCTGECRPGCACKKGLVKNKKGECVEPDECKDEHAHNCKMDEEYYGCKPTCRDTCDNYDDKHAACTFICRPGCACKKGTVRNHRGKCVKPDECEDENPHECKKDEEYYQCKPTCKDTCENYDYEHPRCTRECRPGCACKKGLVRNSKGRCVKPDQCENDHPHQCKKGEEYYKCKPTCRNTCENYDDKYAKCTKECRPGCACKKGLVKNKKGVCVEPDECEDDHPHECKKGEEYYKCKPICRDTCENYDDKHAKCTKECRPGCACKEGLVKNKKGQCVEPEECADDHPHQCKKGEEYYKCKPTCRDTCENYDDKYAMCTKKCRPGCACKKGLVKNKKGDCVEPAECEDDHPHQCKKGEEYYKCKPTCRDTCENYDDKYAKCTKECRPGCACKKGLVKNKKGQCVEPDECKDDHPHDCKKGEEYYKCKPTCRDTCENYDDKYAMCTKKCRPGCACKKSLVKNKKGDCVEPDECEDDHPHECKKGEEYYKCKPTCRDTCENYHDKHAKCTKECRPGCACKKGLVKNHKGICVEPDECETERCSVNEEIVPCSKPKWCNTCSIRGDCKLIDCEEGCDCKPNYYRNKKGICIPEEDCPKPHEECEDDEEYLECGPGCPKTCDNYKGKRECARPCVKGCFCKSGLVRSKEGRCIKPKDCPKGPHECGKNQEYYKCKPTCRNTCENYWAKKPTCPRICISGCECKVGFVLRKDGECVRPKHCKQGKLCSINEEIVPCPKPKWCNTCALRGDCQLIDCEEGCDCKPNHYRNKIGICIPEEDCPKPHEECANDEEYQECGTSCPKTCENYKDKNQMCTYQCVEGCFCKHGMVRSKEGKCVKPSDCPNGNPCPEYERETDCVDPCSSCEYAHKPCNIKPICRKGCNCIEGYFRNKNGKCIPKDKCPKDHDCKKDEKFYECIPDCSNTCETYGIRDRILCPAICRSGCFCKEGLVKRKDGKCVPYEKCPSDVCPENEVPSNCASPCNTCKEKGDCDYDCYVRCDCKKGYFRDADGKCIPENQCPKGNDDCRKDEQFYECVPSCTNTCENYGIRDRILCPAICNPGCFCKEGLVKRKDGECVPYEKCPSDVCPKNEAPSNCVSPCNTCKEKNDCDYDCSPGCDCKKWYYRDADGKCIPEKQCPSEKCNGDGEKYTDCIPCKGYCETYGSNIACKRPCVAGCGCEEGLVRRKDGKCVPPRECKHENTCPENEEETDCVNPCSSCDYAHKPCNIKPLCRQGCNCIQGYFRKKEGRCIPKDKCPKKEECSDDKEYKTCGTACPKTCDNLDIRISCIDKCVEGCFCKDGLVRNKDGNCVQPKDCPKKVECVNPCRACKYIKVGCPIKVPCRPGCDCIEGYYRGDNEKCVRERECKKDHCPEGEEFNECGTACPKTCDNLNKKFKCTSDCRKGCFCKQGLVRNDKGKCIIPEDCPKDVCPEHEVPTSCVPRCETCDNRDEECEISFCNPGCKCKKDYFRHTEGQCIPENQCPDKNKCKSNEMYLECGTRCPKTCDNLKVEIICTADCVSGCFCKPGLVRSNNGECVEPEDCPRDVCPLNEVPTSCVPRCESCDNEGRDCEFIYCPPGCKCRKGYFRNYNEQCIPKHQCPENCPANEEPSDCVIPCNDCQTRGKCNFLVCNKGCDCKVGYYRDGNGKCIPQEKCPRDICPDGEEFSDCVIPCNDCQTKGNCQFKKCNEGCDCIKGYYRDPKGRCIPEKKCPREKCRFLEKYYQCKPVCRHTCKTYNQKHGCQNQKCVPGCGCIEELVRNDNGDCILPKYCEKQPCPHKKKKD